MRKVCTQAIALLLLCMASIQAHSQTDSVSVRCGADAAYLARGAVNPESPYAYTPSASSFPSSAIFTCGKIDVYYADVARHLKTGFDDTTTVGSTTLGAIRRNTYCAVLTYIQSVIDFSNVSDSAHIRLYMDTSIAPGALPAYSFYPPVQFAARAYPQYDSTVAGIKNGWMNDYITRPSWHLHDSISSSLFHGVLQVNFDKTYSTGLFGLVTDSLTLSWQSDVTAPFTPVTSCEKLDLFSLLLHETSHCMGWFSLIGFNSRSAGLVPAPVITTTPHVFSGLDWAYYVGSNTYPLVLTKLLSGTASAPVLDTTNPIFYATNNYWLNDSAAPDNHPVYSGGWPSGVSHSFLSHMDDQQLNYTMRLRISPGMQQDYVMGPFGLQGCCAGNTQKESCTGL